MNNYDDIINLPHYTSSKRKRMSMESRASQFAAFAALTGYEDAIKETARTTTNKIEMGEEDIKKLNNRINIIEDNIESSPVVKVTYFIRDLRKNGGKYIEYTGNVRRLDFINRIIIFKDKKRISFDDILEIDSQIFI